MAKVTGSLTSATRSLTMALTGKFTFSISGTFVATVTLQRSFDGGVTWNNMTDGTYTAPVEKNGEEVMGGVLYALNCSAYTSGTINYLIGNGA